MADVDLLPPGVDPSDRPPGVDVSPVIDTPVAETPVEESLVEEEAVQVEKIVEEPPKKKNLYNDEYDLDADNPLAGSGDEDDGIQVTIGEIKPVNVQFSLNRTHHERQYTSKLDIDAVPTINDQPIYDVDLASMEDRPWRKPGADINDYFNYGFTEETWNTYCERQKKLRTEFTSQAAVNKALFSNIHLANPLGMPSMNARHTNVSGNDNIGNVKVLTDNGGRFKVHHHGIRNDEPVMRTVIGVPNTNTNVTAPAMDFSKPPPGMNMPPPNINLGAPSVSEAPGTDGPPGIAPPGAGPPGIDGPPGIEMGGQNAIPTVGSGGGLDMSVPPPGFNPALPPPGMSVRPPPIGLPPMGPPGPFNNMLPPPGYNNGVRYPMNPQGASMGRPRPLIDRSYDSRRESGDVDDERRYRRRSRSRSPRRSDRRRDDDRRDRDRDRSDRKDRDRDRTERSRRHRSRSREDRDKRRDRKEDDSDRRKRRHDDDDDRRERRERRKKDERSPQDDESQDGGFREEENTEKQ